MSLDNGVERHSNLMRILRMIDLLTEAPRTRNELSLELKMTARSVSRYLRTIEQVRPLYIVNEGSYPVMWKILTRGDFKDKPQT